MKTKKPKPKKEETPAIRHEIFIRVSDIPEELFQAISENAKTARRTNGKEVLTFLEQKKYK